MFKFFKRKQAKNIQEWEYSLLKAIAKKLPVRYSFLADQITPDFILDSVPNEFLKDGWKRIICNQSLYNSFKDNSINYKLSGIKIFNSQTKSFVNIAIDLYEGVIIGYKIDKEVGLFDYENIDLTNIQEKSYADSDRNELEKIIGKLDKHVSAQLDIADTFKIEIEKDEFYVIKDFEDGNYLAMDHKGGVYGMIHDPYEIEKIFDKKEDFFRELQSGNFSISEYYERKLSV